MPRQPAEKVSESAEQASNALTTEVSDATAAAEVRPVAAPPEQASTPTEDPVAAVGGEAGADDVTSATDGADQTAEPGAEDAPSRAPDQDRQPDPRAAQNADSAVQGERGQERSNEPSDRSGAVAPNRGPQTGGGQNGQGGAGGNQANQNRGNENQGNQQVPRGDDAEPGNRRRRRRGRDRERGPSVESDDVYLGEPIDVEGLLDLRDEGFGFLRLKGFFPSKEDVYVSVKQVRQFALRKGDKLKGKSRAASRNEKNPALLQIDSVNDMDPEKVRQRPRFEDLTPLFPDEKLRLEMADDPTNMTARIVDLIAPIGKGQRGLIVSPPKAGKTTVMKQIARSVEVNNPEVHLIVLLVDERPEEVTDMRRWLLRGEVAASTFDRPSEEHTALSELVIERAKRMVEEGKDVVIILDGITRLARAYNLSAPATGRIMSGGIDAGALYPPKRFFGAARNVEEGGSLTILATALVETNSRMDDHIFEEFKGTGNMELKLDRKLADRRIYPAIDVDASSTRHEELLFERRQLEQVWRLRRVLSGLSGEGASGAAGLELLIDRMKTFKSNNEFLAEVAKAPSVG